MTITAVRFTRRMIRGLTTQEERRIVPDHGCFVEKETAQEAVGNLKQVFCSRERFRRKITMDEIKRPISYYDMGRQLTDGID